MAVSYADNNEVEFNVQQLLKENNDFEQKIEQLQKDTKSVEEYKNIIDRQDKRIEDIDSHISELSIFLALIAIIASWLGIYKVRAESKNSVEEWLNKEGVTVLQNKISEAENLLNELNTVLNNANEKDKTLDSLLEKHQGLYEITSLPEKHETIEDILEARVIMYRKAKQDNNFQTWNDTGKLAFLMEDYTNAQKYLENALSVSNTNEETMRALYNKAITLYKLDVNHPDILLIYNRILKDFSSEKSEKSEEILASTMLNKSLMLLRDNTSEAIKVYNQFKNRFQDSKNENIQQILEKLKRNVVPYLS
ncbi:MAG: hypothetical protein Q8N01_09625 [Sulfuricurvum sp.]|nr:hypothetical protein [Sulfuricurvum sp.]